MEKEELKALTEVEARSRSNTKRLDNLEKAVGAIHEFAKNLAVMNVNIEGMNNTLVNLVERVANIENREVDDIRKTKWELKRSIIGALVSIAISGLVAYIVVLINTIP